MPVGFVAVTGARKKTQNIIISGFIWIKNEIIFKDCKWHLCIQQRAYTYHKEHCMLVWLGKWETHCKELDTT